MTSDFKENLEALKVQLSPEKSYDVVYRVIKIGERDAFFFFIDGFCKDELMQKMLQFLMGLKPEDLPDNAHDMTKKYMPHVEVDLSNKWDDIIHGLLSGQTIIIIDGYDTCIMLDTRTYPSRSMSEPVKEKALRGSRDGFVETIVFNTALLRRRIRSTKLRVEMLSAGKSSQTDIAVCYMDDRVDHKMLCQIKNRIKNIHLDALSMNQESLAECLYQSKWYNPFPKFKYTERPDTAAAHVLEGNIVLFVDNAPSAMIIPVTIFDMVEEVDDYYFPPITGTYLRFSRFIIGVLTYLLTPTFLLLCMYPRWIPDWLKFIEIADTVNVPVLLQLLILELSLDGLKLAAVNTPNMLSTPLSVVAGIVLGEFAVKSGWFNSEVMLYMAFVAIANYTQSNYELGYALKFMRIITLILTGIAGVFGYAAGILICLLCIIFNKTIAGNSYLGIGSGMGKIWKRFFRIRQEQTSEK
ncbi:MAG: spore germination protein [Lachnospiraceae bacterium]|nr:spore germination protein [Lachnospiraceae bacterium]